MSVKKILIVFNPISGRGNGKVVAENLQLTLQAKGFEVFSADSENTENIAWKCFDRVVVVGGDGTLRKCLPQLCETAIPVCLYPCGNQNLFAKRFLYPKTLGSFCNVVVGNRVESNYIGVVNGQLFFFMFSLGFDGHIVSKVCAKRSGKISNWNYFVEIIKSFISFRSPLVSVNVDGRVFVDNERGYVIVANSREYALNCSVVPGASAANPFFDVKFIPCKTAIGFFTKAFIRKKKGKEISHASKVFVETKSDSNMFAQVDGDFIEGSQFDLSVASMPIMVVSSN